MEKKAFWRTRKELRKDMEISKGTFLVCLALYYGLGIILGVTVATQFNH